MGGMKKWVLGWLCGAGLLAGAGVANAQGRLVAEALTRSEGIGSPVELNQPGLLADALRQDLVRSRAKREFRGFRVRVYRGLGRNARAQSVEVADRLKAQHPGLDVYRSYQAPYYLTTVGNCRTRIDALFLQHQLLGSFPQAFVIEEDIDFPPLCAPRQQAEGKGEAAL